SNKKQFNNVSCDAFKTVAEKPILSDDVPHVTRLQDCYPNPFNPVTVISYQLSEDAHVKLTVIDALGREVATLVNEMESAGYKSIEFDASSLPSGVYFYRLTAGTFTDMKKMLLAK
ncbi:MAG: T9SS type A sorting domain-containing protein, partial [Ignavibacteriae bacterium]|nr:T9SS type A sorting domain-containing protein [Ignavibacteriota bacterium]